MSPVIADQPHAEAARKPLPVSELVALRHDWTLAEARALHDLPLLELIYRAQTVHRAAFGEHAVQLCSLLSIKTGGCAEDCAYCPQSARYHTGVRAEQLLSLAEVTAAARRARQAGATRFCMGAAWREVKEGPQFDAVLEMVRAVRAMGMEACCTLGMLSDDQARRLKEAGLSAYNHNLDTSAAFYGEIITTRSYQDRLDTLRRVRAAGISVCSGGIIGMGESIDDRCELLRTLANQAIHPESVPINALVAVPGTPLENRPPVEPVELVRAIATARILMPRAMVRLSAGRLSMTQEAQLLCLMAGANSIFFGDKLLTTPNPEYGEDMSLLAKAGVRALEPFAARGSSVHPAATWAAEELEQLSQLGLRRQLEPLQSRQGAVIQIAGEKLINFSSNDYLGLAGDPSLADAAMQGLRTHGLGAGASRLLVGDSAAHHSLEEKIARWMKSESALLFNTGYAANSGILPALCRAGDAIFADELNHASLIDGCRLSRATIVVYPHGDLAALGRLLASTPARRRLVCTEAVFSMDGDRAPLVEMVDLCRRRGAALMVDEAHALGILGSTGAGLCEELGLAAEVDVRVGTLGKALGAFGAFAAASQRVVELLINRARTLIFSTSLPPAICCAVARAVDLVDAQPELRSRLWRNIRQFCDGLSQLGVAAQPHSAIFPIVLGEPDRAVDAAEQLRKRGVLAKAIRPPTVPAGTSRLRFSICASHQPEQIALALSALEGLEIPSVR